VIWLSIASLHVRTASAALLATSVHTVQIASSFVVMTPKNPVSHVHV
jgi:hypothetical protein